MSDIAVSDTMTLGKLTVSPMGTGTWAWGDSLVWGYQRGADADLKAAFEASLASGITLFDTAEMYGLGRSEQLVGQFEHEHGTPVMVATKFMPLPWRVRKSDLLNALRRSLQRLGRTSVDLYQIHWPSAPVPVEWWAEALADALEAGLTKEVGVSNYSVNQMQRVQSVLVKRGFALASNQVEYSLIQRSPERNGLLTACRELGVTLIAYSPLGMGLLTGKYTPSHPPSGPRGRMYNADYLRKLQPLLNKLSDIAAAHGKTPAQVALNWTLCKGTLPIPGAKNVKQIQDNAGALGWRMSPEEVAALDQLAV